MAKNTQINQLKKLLALSSLAVAGAASAQQIPDAGSLLRETERQRPQLPMPAQQAVPQTPIEQAKSDIQITITAFRFIGNLLVTDAELQQVLAGWIGKTADFNDLQQAVDAVAEAYRSRGWFARTQLPAQDISEGIITINILEGKLGTVQIDNQGKTLRISPNFVTNSMTARQKPGDPLDIDALDRSTNILNDTPGLLVTTVLAPGQRDGETDANVKIQEKPLFSGVATFDNTGARSTGENKLAVSTTIDSPFGVGEQFTLNGNKTQGSDYAKLAYAMPIGSDGLRAGVSTSFMRYRLIGDLKSLNALGDAQTYGANVSYPLLRSGTRNLVLSLAVDRKDYYNEANKVASSEKQLHTGILSLSGDMLDGLGAGGLTLASLSLSGGHVDLSGNSTNQAADRSGPQTAGDFLKLGYSLARLQRIMDKLTLWASLNGQVADKNLDSSEKMSLGGPGGVRAYPVLEGTGDDGVITTIELRYNLLPALQVTSFYDYGRIRQSHSANYVGAPTTNSGSLSGYGLGLNYTFAGKFALRAVWARRDGDNPFANPINGLDADGSLDRDRFWLTGTAFF